MVRRGSRPQRTCNCYSSSPVRSGGGRLRERTGARGGLRFLTGDSTAGGSGSTPRADATLSDGGARIASTPPSYAAAAVRCTLGGCGFGRRCFGSCRCCIRICCHCSACKQREGTASDRLPLFAVQVPDEARGQSEVQTQRDRRYCRGLCALLPRCSQSDCENEMLPTADCRCAGSAACILC